MLLNSPKTELYESKDAWAWNLSRDEGRRKFDLLTGCNRSIWSTSNGDGRRRSMSPRGRIWFVDRRLRMLPFPPPHFTAASQSLPYLHPDLIIMIRISFWCIILKFHPVHRVLCFGINCPSCTSSFTTISSCIVFELRSLTSRYVPTIFATSWWLWEWDKFGFSRHCPRSVECITILTRA